MKLFGLEITRAPKTETKALNPPFEDRGGWFPVIREGFAGAWQRNITYDNESVLRNHAVFACVSLIANDIAKLRIKLIQLQDTGVWQETTNPAYSPVLRDPNSFQTDHQFVESWVLSKLLNGNTYALKRRDNRAVVSALYVLDPNRVRPLVSDGGDVFYEIDADNLSGVADKVRVPAREMIHDRWNCFFHPLIGHSPIMHAALSASQGLRIQKNSDAFFRNRAAPSGILTTPANIDEASAQRLMDVWAEEFSEENGGRVAVVGNDLKFQPLMMSSVDAQALEQLKYTAEMICGVFHVPPHMIGVGPMPTQTGIEPLTIDYAERALRRLMEDFEGCLDRGLGLAADIGVEFDGLYRMDTMSKAQTAKLLTDARVMSPNEARKEFDLPPVKGGEKPLSQMQYWPLDVLSNRPPPEPPQAQAPQNPTTPPPPSTGANDNAAAVAAQQNALLLEIHRGLR